MSDATGDGPARDGTGAESGPTPTAGATRTGDGSGRLRGLSDRLRSIAARTVTAVRGALGRRDARAVATGIAFGYLAVFLFAVGDVSLRGGGVSLTLVRDPLGLLFQRTGPLTFEAIALVELGPVRWLLSPVNTAVGGVLAALVGLNIALTYLAVVQPRACGIGASAGLFASLPALLSGTACCGPVLLVVLGIQASGLLIGLFGVLLPAGVVLLVGSLAYVAGKIDPAALAAAS